MGRPVNPQIIGEHIRLLRTKRDVSVRTFAAQTAFSPSFISQLENGQVSPSHLEALGSMTPSRRLEPVVVTLPAHAPHRWENRGEQIVEILMIASRVRG